MKRPALPLLLAAAAAVAAFAAEPQKTAAPQPAPAQPKLAASVNGEAITIEQLDRMYSQLSPEMKANYEKSGGKAQFLDYLIRKRLVLQEAAKQNFDTRPEVQEAVQAARDSVVFDHYIRDVVSESVVTEADMQAYYQMHKVDFDRPLALKLRHIVVTSDDGPVTNTTGDNAKTKEAALQKIRSLATAIHNGASFVDLAAKFSEDGTADLGGDLGWMQFGTTVPEFEQAALRLKKGEVSDVVETPFGYHLILVEDRRESGIAPYSDVREQIRETLLRQKAGEILTQVNLLANQLRAQSRITIYRENF